MTKRFDVCSPRPRKDSDKPFWHRVGTAFQSDKGIQILFDSLPLPDKEGRVAVSLFESKPKDGAAQERTSAPSASAARPQRADMDDEIPF